MGNSGKVTEIIDTAATTGQYKTLSDQLDALDLKFIELTKDVLAFNSAAKDAKGFADFNKNAGQAAIAAEKLLQVQNQTAITAAKLAEQENKTASAIQRTQDARDKAAAKQQAQTDKAVANSQKEAAATEAAEKKKQDAADKTNTEYAKLLQRQKDLNNAALQSGAAFGVQSKEYKEAAVQANKVSAEVNAINQGIGNFRGNVGNYADGVANGLGKVFGTLRQVAYILPGIGLAGLIGIIVTGTGKLIDLYSSLTSLAKLNNELQSKANDIYAEQASKINSLNKEVQAGNISQGRGLELLDEFNKISPTYFGNLKTIDDLYKLLPADLVKYNKALEITSRIQAEQSLIADNYKKQLQATLDVDYTKGLAQGTKFFQGNNDKFKSLVELLKYVYSFRGGDFGKKEIEETTKAITNLNNRLLADQKALQANGGDIAGNQIKLQESVINNYIEQEKIKTQTTLDVANEIAGNEKKSYATRKAALAASAEAQKQILESSLNQQLNDVSLTEDKRSVLIDKYKADRAKVDLDYDKQARDLRTKAAKDEIDLENQRLERQKKIAENKFTDPTLGYQDRFKALADYQKAAEDLIKNTEKIAVQDAGDNAVKRKIAEEKAGNDILDVKNDIAKKTLSIQKDINEENSKLLKQQFDAEVASEKALENVYTNEANARLLAIDKSYSDQVLALDQLYASGQIKTAEYNTRLLKLDQATAQTRIQVQIDTARKILAAQAAALALGFGDPQAAQKTANDLVKLQIQQSDLLAKTEIDNIRKVQEAKQQNADLEKQLQSESIQLIQELIDNGYEAQIKKLQEQSTQLDDNANKEKEIVDNSLASSQNKAKQDKIIDAQTAASKEQLSEKQKDIQKKEALFNKAISIFNIALTTAESVAKIEAAISVAQALATVYLADPVTALLYPGIAALIAAQQLEVGLVVASGALQIAAIAAASPKYAKGTKNHPGGTAWVGDGGMSELVKLPDGNTFLSEPRATLMDLPKGTTVIPGLETVNMLQKINYTGGQKLDMREANALLRENNKYQKKIAEKPTETNTRGLASQLAEGLAWNDRRNAYFK